MAVALNPRAERLLARLPRFTVYSVAELLLLVLVAVQCARLFWALLTPLGPVGEYRALSAAVPIAQSASTLATFDPFFRQAPGSAASPVVVTALDIRLYGTREDRATGRGSAIIGTPDGRQISYMVGEEILPGVVLTAVAFDHVTVTRGGAAEQLFLDQSSPAGPGTPGAPGAPTRPTTTMSPMQAQPVPVVRAPPPQPPPPVQPGNMTQPMRVSQ